ncbi:putative zinc metalloprotease Rip3 [Methanosarcinaceae archaeon Ag5]|uniref:Zinc metalloprotease n=1 Tax=Methanolapillus africanus TaxID=3028297 RepID=A0AAE4SCQ5_9EURY|nr:putative zinc metalloprotease Rip3 [Methanosarcinaceae archaeon Ag5]
MAFKIATIKGIPIYIHMTFLLVFLLFAFMFDITRFPYGFAGVEPAMLRYIFSVAAAFLFFVTLLIHELCHSILATSYGIKIQGITLFFFGGVSMMENPKDEKMVEPSKELKIALAGPLSSIILGLLFLGLNYAAFGVFYGAPLISGSIMIGSWDILYRDISVLLFLVGALNLILGIFNILPVYPMDGGRVLRAWLAKRYSFQKATEIAVQTGKIFSVVMAIVGIFFNLWLALLAVFLYISAAEEGKAVKTTFMLENVTVGDIMTKNVITVDESMKVSDFVNFVFQNKHPGYPVTHNGVVTGTITVDDIKRINEAERYALTVKDAMKTDVISVAPETPALDAFEKMNVNFVGRLVVLDAGKNLAGILSRTDLMTAINLRSSLTDTSNLGPDYSKKNKPADEKDKDQDKNKS